MATLNGHEAGNGGYNQEPTYGQVVASPTRSDDFERAIAGLAWVRKVSHARLWPDYSCSVYRTQS